MEHNKEDRFTQRETATSGPNQHGWSRARPADTPITIGPTNRRRPRTNYRLDAKYPSFLLKTHLIRHLLKYNKIRQDRNTTPRSTQVEYWVCHSCCSVLLLLKRTSSNNFRFCLIIYLFCTSYLTFYVM